MHRGDRSGKTRSNRTDAAVRNGSMRKPPMVEIRAFRPADLEDLYRICLATAGGGDDASARYSDPRLVGHVYAAPYAVLSPFTVFVAEDSHGVGGYIVG